MRASPISRPIFFGLFLLLSFSAIAQSGQYTVQVDSMTAQEAAESKVQSLKAQGLNAYWLKSNVPGQGIRYRVRIGRFPNRIAAQSYGAKLKQQGHTADFFIALFEGNSSPLGATEVAKKTPPPAPPVTPKPTPVETKPLETKATVNKPAVTVAPKQPEVKPIPAPTLMQPASPAASTAEKPVTTAPPKPISVPTAAPANNTPAPKPMAPAPSESKPLQSKPLTPIDDSKAPRDKKAENTLPNNSSSPAAVMSAATAANKPEPLVEKKVTEVGGPNLKALSGEAATPVSVAAFLRFEERSFGYSFEHPTYWNGGRLTADELQAQRIDAGAVFRSQEDVAFMNAIWNSLKNANSPAYDNNLIVDLVIKSLSSGAGLQGLTEVSRRMVQEGDQIKTFVDLRTLFRQPRANSPLEFQGKAVIIRANTGILLVVSFYSKESAPAMIAAAERIVSSARVP